jgi:hypothetical protein
VVEKAEPPRRATADARAGHGLRPQGNFAGERWDDPPLVVAERWEPTCACGDREGWNGDPEPPTLEPEPCVVLDPFLGSGTTGVAALRAGRSFVGVELNPDYAAMAEGRLAPLRAQGRLL